MNTFVEVELDDELRQQFDEILDKVGLDENTAFNIFVKAVVRYKRIPFELSAFRSHKITGAAKRPLEAARQYVQDTAVNIQTKVKEAMQKIGLDLSQLDFSQLDFSKIDWNNVIALTSQILDYMDNAANAGRNRNRR